MICVMFGHFLHAFAQHSPTFLVQFFVSIMSASLLLDDFSSALCHEPSLKIFYIILLVQSSSEIFFKGLVYPLLYVLDRGKASTLNVLLIIIYSLLHVGIWIYCLTLALRQDLGGCPRDRFVILTYASAYGAITLVAITLACILIWPALVLTYRHLKRPADL